MVSRVSHHGKQVKIYGRHVADCATENDAKVIAEALEKLFSASTLLSPRALA